jgi:hypothetical protein
MVFDWVTTWGNLPRWLGVASGGVTQFDGDLAKPSRFGDRLVEHFDPGGPVNALRYTVGALRPGHLWVAAGQVFDPASATADDVVMGIATFTVELLDEGCCTFTRIFQLIRPASMDPDVALPVTDPHESQLSVDRARDAMESEMTRH